MFVRVKKTPNSPRKSVQIVHSFREGDRVRQRIVKHIGVAQNDEELEELKLYANKIKLELEQEGQLPLYGPEELEKLARQAQEKLQKKAAERRHPAQEPFSSMEEISEREKNQVNLLDLVELDRQIKGIHDIYGKLYEELGFHRVIGNPARHRRSVEILRHLVLARIANADSKRATREALEKNFGVKLRLESLYKTMDRLDDKAIERLQRIVFDATRSLFDEKVDVLYFDVTTLYFESFEEDDLRQKGFSKDGKPKETQVVLALLVSKQGLPIGYRLFPGSTYEGHTLIPTLEALRRDFKVDKVVFVADSGMLSRANLEALEAYGKAERPEEERKGEIVEEKEGEGHSEESRSLTHPVTLSYIVGARIKNLSTKIQEQILDLESYEPLDEDRKVKEIRLEDGRRLILSYSKKRARKDQKEREKAIEKLRSKLDKDPSLKSKLSNQGYRKFLKVDTDTSKAADPCRVTLDEEKIEADARFDGLKGVLTNDPQLSKEEILHQYAHLWVVEESFRIHKHDLRIRPIFHFKESRIKAHIALCFMAYTLVRHLEYRIRLRYKKLSPRRIKQLLLSVQVSLLQDRKTQRKYLFPSHYEEEVKKIYRVMEVELRNRAVLVDEGCSA